MLQADVDVMETVLPRRQLQREPGQLGDRLFVVFPLCGTLGVQVLLRPCAACANIAPEGAAGLGGDVLEKCGCTDVSRQRSAIHPSIDRLLQCSAILGHHHFVAEQTPVR